MQGILVSQEGDRRASVQQFFAIHDAQIRPARFQFLEFERAARDRNDQRPNLFRGSHIRRGITNKTCPSFRAE